jgi:hypothetical protein
VIVCLRRCWPFLALLLVHSGHPCAGQHLLSLPVGRRKESKQRRRAHTASPQVSPTDTKLEWSETRPSHAPPAFVTQHSSVPASRRAARLAAGHNSGRPSNVGVAECVDAITRVGQNPSVVLSAFEQILAPGSVTGLHGTSQGLVRLRQPDVHRADPADRNRCRPRFATGNAVIMPGACNASHESAGLHGDRVSRIEVRAAVVARRPRFTRCRANNDYRSGVFGPSARRAGHVHAVTRHGLQAEVNERRPTGLPHLALTQDSRRYRQPSGARSHHHWFAGPAARRPPHHAAARRCGRRSRRCRADCAKSESRRRPVPSAP